MVDALSSDAARVMLTVRMSEGTWRNTADARNAWIDQTWRELALPGVPPPEIRLRNHWRQRDVQSFIANGSAMRHSGADPWIQLYASRGYGTIRHAHYLALPMRHF